MKPSVTELSIKTAESGFYRGFTKDVAITAKVLIGALVVWAVAFPDNAAAVLSGMNSLILASCNFWYVYVMAFFFVTCIVLAVLPVSGRMKLGRPEDKSEFSRFSWFSMMFGAGIGIGMLTYATGEPIFHFQTNPDIILGLAEGSSEEAVHLAYKWSFSHWGLHAWTSYSNVGLSLAFFLFFGSTFFGLQALFVGIFDYLVGTPALLFTVWSSGGVEGSVSSQLAGWQGSWTVFYWAWWIAFAPFVGVFLARISKGRTIREYVLGAAIVPSVIYFVWFALVGGTAIDLELSGVADNAIIGTGLSDQLFATLSVMLSETMAWIFAIMVVVLLLTNLVTSAESAVLIINTINAAGDEGPKARPHILFWGAALALVVGALLMIGGLGAIQTAMIIGALPFNAVMVLMGVSVLKAIWRDSQREKMCLPVFDEENADAVPVE